MSHHRLLLPALALATTPLFGAVTDGMIVNLNFDNNTANAATGSSITTSVIGTAGVPVYTSGQFGSAATFNNTNAGGAPNDWALSLGNMDAYYASDFSFSLWVKTTSTADQAFFGNSDWTSGGNTGWLLNTISGKEGKFKTGVGTRQDQALAIHTGNWVNVIAVVDATATSVTWYLGGVVLGTQTYGAGTLSAGFNTLIGASGNGTYGASAVSIDEVGMWNRKLTGGEIAALQIAAVPEPSSYGLGAAGLAAVVAWKRRRSQRRS